MHSGLKTTLLLLLAAGLGISGAKGYQAWMKFSHRRGFDHYEGPPVVTGVGDAPADHGFCVADASQIDALAERWKSANATAVGLEYGPGMDRQSLIGAAGRIHKQGLHIVLLPPGTIAGTAWSAHDPYPRPLADIGADAEAAGVETVCISWLNRPPEADYWRTQVQAMRLTYSGKLILAADARSLERVTCPDVAEILGAIGPIEIPERLPTAPDDVNVKDLRVAWDCQLTELENLAKKYDKKLALLHMDVPLTVRAGLAAPGAAAPLPVDNPALQGQMYEALLLETKGRSVTTTTLLFDWGFGGRGAGDAPNLAAGVMGKIAPAWAEPARTAVVAQRGAVQ